MLVGCRFSLRGFDLVKKTLHHRQIRRDEPNRRQSWLETTLPLPNILSALRRSRDGASNGPIETQFPRRLKFLHLKLPKCLSRSAHHRAAFLLGAGSGPENKAAPVLGLPELLRVASRTQWAVGPEGGLRIRQSKAITRPKRVKYRDSCAEPTSVPPCAVLAFQRSGLPRKAPQPHASKP